MTIRSAKVQFLFWVSFFSVMLYLAIVTIGFQTFVYPNEMPLHIPENSILLLFLMYGLLGVLLLAGTIISTMINNRYYMRFFSISMIVGLVTLLFTKGMFG